MCLETNLKRRRRINSGIVSQSQLKLSSTSIEDGTWNNDRILLHFRVKSFEGWKMELLDLLNERWCFETILNTTHNGHKFLEREFLFSFSPFVCPGWVSWLLLINWFCLTFCDAVKIDIREIIPRRHNLFRFCHILSKKKKTKTN